MNKYFPSIDSHKYINIIALSMTIIMYDEINILDINLNNNNIYSYRMFNKIIKLVKWIDENSFSNVIEKYAISHVAKLVEHMMMYNCNNSSNGSNSCSNDDFSKEYGFAVDMNNISILLCWCTGYNIELLTSKLNRKDVLSSSSSSSSSLSLPPFTNPLSSLPSSLLSAAAAAAAPPSSTSSLSITTTQSLNHFGTTDTITAVPNSIDYHHPFSLHCSDENSSSNNITTNSSTSRSTMNTLKTTAYKMMMINSKKKKMKKNYKIMGTVEEVVNDDSTVKKKTYDDFEYDIIYNNNNNNNCCEDHQIYYHNNVNVKIGNNDRQNSFQNNICDVNDDNNYNDNDDKIM